MSKIPPKEELLELLPSGSGIDSDWDITVHKNGNVTAKNSCHAMNEHGYYDGYMPFTVRIFKVKKTRVAHLKGIKNSKLYQIIEKKGDISFTVSCNENARASFYGLKDYIEDTVYHNLRSIITPIRTKSYTYNEIRKYL